MRVTGSPLSAPTVTRQAADTTVAIVEIDVPFGSVLKLMFKGAIAAVIVGTCLMPIVFALYVIIALLFVGGVLSGLPHR